MIEQELTQKDIKNLYDEHYTARSITREIASIKGFFKWLSINDIIQHNPALAIEQPKLPKRLPKVLSVKEITELLIKPFLNYCMQRD